MKTTMAAQKEGVEAIVSEILPANLFRLALPDGREVLAHMSGRMLFNHIRVLLGDRVLVWLDPYNGKTTNRIIRRV